MRYLKGSILLAMILIFAFNESGYAEVLITEAEAKLPQPVDRRMATRGITRGPGIEFISPATGAQNLQSPVKLRIRFVARNNVAIDPASVKLTYLRSPPVDLTARIKPFLNKDGIDMAQAEMPPGNHVIRIDVRDVEGRSASQTFTLSVATK